MLRNLFLLLLLAGSSFAWWDASFPYRTQVNISNGGMILTDYQVNISLNTQALIAAGKMRSDCADLRAVASNDSAQLPFWIESGCNTTATKIWMKVPSIPAGTSTIFAYYGNASALSASNVNNTFIRTIDDGQPVKGAWAFDGNANDNSGNSNHGSLQSGASYTAGKFGQAVLFDGIDDYVTVPDAASLDINGAITISAWINTTDTFGGIIAKWWNIDETGYSLMMYDTNKLNLLADSGATTPSITSINSGTWRHIVGTYTGSAAKLYIDGVLDKEYSDSGMGVNNIALTMGRWISGTYSYSGIIDEPRVYNRALTQAEITDLYNNYGYVTPNYPGRELVRKYASTEPTASALSEEEAFQFTYRKEITLNNAGSALTDYQTNLTLDTAALVSAGKMRSDCGDLRFTNSTIYSTQSWAASYPYWLESGCNTNATRAWVKVPLIPNGTSIIYAYHGNSSALPASNGASTFVFFDDFDNLNSWTQQAGVWTAANSILTFPGNAAPPGAYLKHTTVNPYTTDYAVRFKGKLATNAQDERIFLILNSATPLEKGTTGNVLEFSQTGGDGNALAHDYYGTKTQTAATMSADTWYIFEASITNAQDKLTAQTTDYVSKGAHTTANTRNNGDYFGFLNYYDGQNQVDWLTLRKYALPEPTVAEQQPDTTVPFVQIQSPISQAYATAIVPVNFTATDNAAVSCIVRLNGTVNSSTCSNYTLTLLNGAYTLNITANDTTGNTNSAQVSFTIATDTTLPLVAIQSPATTTYTTGTIPVNFTATDDTAISYCIVRLNGTINSSTCSNYTLTLANGAYTLNVTANDTSGNNNSAQISFTVAVSTEPQSSSSPQISTLSGIADGNVSFSFTPASLRIRAGVQEYPAKSMRISAGVTKVQIRARVTSSGQLAPDGTKVTYTLSE